MGITKEILIGVGSGIILSGLTAIIIKIWNIKVKPFLQKYFYKDVSLSGEWISKGKDDFGKYTLHMNIQHNANNITGTTNRVQDNKVEMKYRFFGIVRNSIVNIIYTECKNVKNRFDIGNFIGKIEFGGMRITGIMSYLSNINDDKLVTISDMILKRVHEGELYDVGSKR